VRATPTKLGLSQAELSRRYAVSPRSLQEWEEGRRRPGSVVRAFLTVMDRNPKAVEKALLNKSWVAQALLPVSRAEASHAERTGKSACATVRKPEPATDRTR
jgi:hypothetical protein